MFDIVVSENSRNYIDCEEFQSIMQHLPPSVFFVVMKNAETRDAEAQSSVKTVL